MDAEQEQQQQRPPPQKQNPWFLWFMILLMVGFVIFAILFCLALADPKFPKSKGWHKGPKSHYSSISGETGMRRAHKYDIPLTMHSSGVVTKPSGFVRPLTKAKALNIPKVPALPPLPPSPPPISASNIAFNQLSTATSAIGNLFGGGAGPFGGGAGVFSRVLMETMMRPKALQPDDADPTTAPTGGNATPQSSSDPPTPDQDKSEDEPIESEAEPTEPTNDKSADAPPRDKSTDGSTKEAVKSGGGPMEEAVKSADGPMEEPVNESADGPLKDKSTDGPMEEPVNESVDGPVKYVRAPPYVSGVEIGADRWAISGLNFGGDTQVLFTNNLHHQTGECKLVSPTLLTCRALPTERFGWHGEEPTSIEPSAKPINVLVTNEDSQSFLYYWAYPKVGLGAPTNKQYYLSFTSLPKRLQFGEALDAIVVLYDRGLPEINLQSPVTIWFELLREDGVDAETGSLSSRDRFEPQVITELWAPLQGGMARFEHINFPNRGAYVFRATAVENDTLRQEQRIIAPIIESYPILIL